ncbi:hypothetical protein CC79DRAFT_543934 [Sarocladium strictum]
MPKRGSESRVSKPEITNLKAQKKSERSHEENQERAYIAASRRADRSIEARVQSARMASEIHKKRTGKSFRITEDIVIKEEMYEEEDDDFPRSYRLLGPHMQTGSSEMNSRLEAFLTNKIAMSQYVARGGERWEKENEINKLFAASFPNLDAQAKALSQSFSNPNYGGAAQTREESGAPNTHNSHPQSPLSPVSPTFQHRPQLPVTYQRNDSANSDLSPPALSPGSPTSRATPSFSMPGPMDFGGSSSAFTTELPNEARMMFAGMTPTAQDPYSQASMFDPSLTMDWMNGGTPQPQYYDPKMERNDGGLFDTTNTMQSPAMHWDPTLSNAQANDDDWNDFINDQAWGETQAQ